MAFPAAPPPLRILHVTPFLAPPAGFGGIARACAGLAREQARRGHHVTVVTAGRGRGPAEAREDGVRVLRLPAHGPRLLPFCRGLGAVLQGEVPRADVVHLHGHRHGLALPVPAACRRAGRPYVLQTHGTWPHHGQRRLAKAAFDAAGGRRVVESASAVIAVSGPEAADLRRPAVVVPNGIDAPPRPRPPRVPGPPRLLFVGNGSAQKRARLLPALLERLPDAQLALVGDVTSGHPRMRAAGVLEDAALWDEMQAADVLVQPAVGEAFGLVAFEAAVLGTPAVVAGGHGAGEWFARAGGTVTEADDVDAMAAAVSRLLHDADEARAEAAAVAAFVERELRWPLVAPRVEQAYAQARR